MGWKARNQVLVEYYATGQAGNW